METFHAEQSPCAKMIKSRLREWAGWLHSPSYSAHSGRTVEYRIMTERENAGAKGDGMKYEIIEVAGEAIICRPDGGMWRAAVMGGRQLALDNRCIETHKAVEWLPADIRIVVVRRWVRPDQRDKPLSYDQIALMLKLPKETVRDRHLSALAKLERRIYGPFMPAPATVAHQAPALA